MTYIEWNNAIFEHFFNPEKAETEVFLFITREDVIEIGRHRGLDGNEEIFLDYIESLRIGTYGPHGGNILDYAIKAYNKWVEYQANPNGEEIKYPLYIGYLCLFMLPLTEHHKEGLRVDAYYPKLKKLLKKYNLPHIPSQNEFNNWNLLWQDLETWSIITKNTALGFLEIHPFKNKRWVYVGKPLSQSLLPGNALKSLPELFVAAGLVPGIEITNEEIRQIIIKHGRSQLGLSTQVIEIVKDKRNEFGDTIIKIIKRKFHSWEGATDIYDTETQTIKKGYTIVQLRLCMEGDRIKGFKTYYRLYTKLDYPEDLTFLHDNNSYPCRQFGNGWSKPVFIPYNDYLEVQDKLNKWTAKFPLRKVRLLMEGKNFHLAGWVEVSNLVVSKMLLIVTDDLARSIEQWGELFSEGDFKIINLPGIPVGYNLYEIVNPPIGHPDISALQFSPDKRISIIGGIKIGVRTWLNRLLPEIQLENGLGTEKLILEYEESKEISLLERKETDQPIWLLPKNIKSNSGFKIKIIGQQTNGDQFRNFVIDAENINNLSDDFLPARDKFGHVTDKINAKSYAYGSRLQIQDENEERLYNLRQNIYSLDFCPHNTEYENEDSSPQIINPFNELLLTYLTVKGQSIAKDFFEVFDSIYQKRFTPEEIDQHKIELSRLKRGSLNFLDYMGYLDYEYTEKERIVVNPPRFILIPTQRGRKVVMIGGRTRELIEKIQDEAVKVNLQFKLENQNPTLTPFLLPQALTLTGYDKNGPAIIARIQEVAEKCSIGFDPRRFTQFRLAEFSGAIKDFESTLIPDNGFQDLGWSVKAFDVGILHFRPLLSKDIDRRFSLIEYRLNEYKFIHRLWKNGVPFFINKNWGRYLILQKNNVSVILNDRERKLLAIPSTVPLPRLLSEAFVLYSGLAPIRVELEYKGEKVLYNVYHNLPHIIAYNSCLKVGQRIIETNIEI